MNREKDWGKDDMVDRRESMERVNRILQHDLFLYHLHANEVAEEERVFCRHNIVHFLDVARIGEIMNLEENCGILKELIYAAALLHDMGKHVQYEDGTAHEIASSKIAAEILKDCGFVPKEIDMIVDAIREHRNCQIQEEANLRGLLYRADKASRACFSCKAESECNWKNGKKNFRIIY